MTNTLLAVVITGILSGGFVGAVTTAWRARKTVPVERDSIIVTGAESAVLSLKEALAAEGDRAIRAEEERDRLSELVQRKDRRIEALETRLDHLQHALDAARDELHKIRNLAEF